MAIEFSTLIVLLADVLEIPDQIHETITGKANYKIWYAVNATHYHILIETRD